MPTTASLLCLLLCWLGQEASADNTFFLSPNVTGTQIAVVLIQGAQCPNAGYRAFAEQLQRAAAAEFAVWVGVPEFVADTPEPIQLGAKFKSVIAQGHFSIGTFRSTRRTVSAASAAWTHRASGSTRSSRRI